MLANAQREASGTSIQNSEFMQDFRQSYVVGRVGIQATQADDDRAEDKLFWQIERVEEIKIQIEKFRRDLGSIRGNPIVSKTVENLNLLKVDFDRTMEQLKLTRIKIQDEQQALINNERSLQNTIDSLRHQQEGLEGELQTLANQNRSLERKIEQIKVDNSNSSSSESLIKNLKIELSDAQSKIEEVESTLRRTREDLDAKERQVFDQRREIESLKASLETLAESVDEPTSAKIRQSIRQANRNDDSSDEIDLDNQASKKELAAENQKLKRDLEDANSKLEESTGYISKLKMEIAELTQSLEAAEEFKKNAGFDNDFNVEGMRMSEMVSMYNKETDNFPGFRQSVAPAVVQEAEVAEPELPKQQTDVAAPEPEVIVKTETVFVEKEVPVIVEKQVIVEKVVEKEVIVEKFVEVENKAEIERLESELKIALHQVEATKEVARNKEIQLGMLEQKTSRMTRDLEETNKKEQELESQISELRSKLESISQEPPIEVGPSEESKRIEEQRLKEFAILKNSLEQIKIELAWYKNNSQKHPQQDSSVQEITLQPILRDSIPLSVDNSHDSSLATPSLKQSITSAAVQPKQPTDLLQKSYQSTLAASTLVDEQPIVSSVTSFGLPTPAATPLLDSKLSQSALGQSTLTRTSKPANPKAIKMNLYNKELLRVQQTLADLRAQIKSHEDSLATLRSQENTPEIEARIVNEEASLAKLTQNKDSYLNIEKEVKLNIAKCLDELQTSIMAEAGITHSQMYPKIQPVLPTPAPETAPDFSTVQNRVNPKPPVPDTPSTTSAPTTTNPSHPDKTKLMNEKLSSLR